MRSRLCSLLLLLAGGLLIGRDADAQSPPADDPLVYAAPPRKQDEVYLLNTRDLDEPDDDDPVVLAMSRINEQGEWETLSIEAFCRDSQADVPTLIYVHGYDFDEAQAQRVGWAMYHALCDELPAQRRVRFVMWSWPSVAKRFRPARDVIHKSRRADAEGYWLAWLIARLPSEARVGLIGSALGCRAIESAMHLAGGGELDDWRVVRPDGKAGPPIRTVFVSPAIHDDWLYPGQMHEAALARTEGILLLNNSQDPTLLQYSRAWPGRPTALGLDGLPSVEKFGELASRIRQVDAHEQIGENHGVEHYLRSQEMVRQMRVELLLGN